MVVDTSAIIAILKQETDHQALAQTIYFSAELCYMSAANLLETYLVVVGSENDPAVWEDVQEFLLILGIEVVSLTQDDIAAAMYGYRMYGKGRHQAKLNFGDCFSYGVAKARNLYRCCL